MDELITNLKDNVNKVSSLSVKNYNNNEDDIFEVCVLNEHNDVFPLKYSLVLVIVSIKRKPFL